MMMIWSVVWNIFIFPYIGLLIIPIDFHIFQRGGPTTNQMNINDHEYACFLFFNQSQTIPNLTIHGWGSNHKIFSWCIALLKPYRYHVDDVLIVGFQLRIMKLYSHIIHSSPLSAISLSLYIYMYLYLYIHLVNI